ncbi:MAG: FKBP-type peptidyl-prolyl cis-trans isomerase [Gammaproteobacteria bacterium]
MIHIQRIASLLSVVIAILLAGCVTNPYTAPPDVAVPPSEAAVLADGLAYQVLRSGTSSAHPTPDSIVTLNYISWTTSGRPFDSSVNPDGSTSPATFPLNTVIVGLQEAVPLMVEGEKMRVWIPGKLAYANGNRPGLPKGMLVFDIELLNFTANPYTPPKDVAAPPADATRLPGGLAYQVLRAGTGSTHPTLASTVTVNYTGWTTDGHKFDSTFDASGGASPATFPLHKLIQGWQDMLPLMVTGERVRVWIPGALAYDNRNRPDAPKGMLVFDIELLNFKD